MSDSQARERRKEWFDAAQKYDYLVVTGAGALLTYFSGEKLEPGHQLRSSLLLIGLSSLLLSLACGFAHLHALIGRLRLEANFAPIRDQLPQVMKRAAEIPPTLFSAEGAAVAHAGVQSETKALQSDMGEVETGLREIDGQLRRLSSARDYALAIGVLLVAAARFLSMIGQ